MKKAIIFDLYGTLIDIHTDEDNPLFWQQMEIYFGYYGVFYDNLKEAYDQAVRYYLDKESADYPDIEILDVFNKLFMDKGVIVDKASLLQTATTFRLLSTDYLQLYPYAKDLLGLLNKSDLKVILLSNAQSAFTLNELKLLGIDKDFDRIYISSDYKLSKPDKKFYEIMLEKEGLDASECVYIGNDHTTDIKGANGVGMDAVYLYTNCSSPMDEDFDCLHKIIPGDLKALIEIAKKWTSKV
ncbi:HAD family hydrolase [Acidaminobacter sp. JC074]|uniref:HAD family hydrolase n=1 Tax=Acidaminobacter sp. JC074 TaxID=2530199 RepID=UPI001F0F9260|nr:HAD family hydrolase [Acidaminobacter sp. JC074]